MNSSATHIYPNFTAQALVNTLQPHTDVIQRNSDSGQLIFATYGGRLLGLYPRAGGPNALWVNPALQQTLEAGEWLTGGERLWLAPERDFFYRDPMNFEGVHVPTAVDPGYYMMHSTAAANAATASASSTERTVGNATATPGTDGMIGFTNQFNLHDFEHQQTYANSSLHRTFQLLNDPYDTGLDYVGVSIDDQVSIPNTERSFCAWSIAQVYIAHRTHPATALVPTLPQAEILTYFDPVSTQQAAVHAGYIRFRLDAAAIYKLAVRPEDVNPKNPVKTLCLMPCPDGEDWFCVVKRSQDMPRTQQQCVDIARNLATTAKGVVQCYNHGPQANETDTPHHFGEIEIQLNPANPNLDGSATSTGSHELLAYTGSRDQMLTLAQQLLQLEQSPAIYLN